MTGVFAREAELSKPFLLNSSYFELIKLLVFLIYHAVLILLPMSFFAVLSFTRGVRNPVAAVSIGACAGGLMAYAAFWFWFLFPRLAVYGVPALYLGIALAWSFLPKITFPPGVWGEGRLVVGLWLFYSLFILAAGFSPTGTRDVLGDASRRFSHPLPIDNQIPYIFSNQIVDGRVLKPMVGDWLSSDRPPLQTGYFLASSTARLHVARDKSYQVMATLLQCLWILPMWLIFRVREIGGRVMFLTLAVILFSGFAVLHSLFVWPKLIPVFFLLFIFAILFDAEPMEAFPWVKGMTVGCLSALALLCHGGSLLALLGMGLALVPLKRIPKAPFIAGAAAVGLPLLMTWSYYQSHFDPPGNRLLKWYLAGVVPIDGRPFLQTLAQSYSALSIHPFIALKLSNLGALVGDPTFWGPALGRAVLGLSDATQHEALRYAQFYSVAASLGVFVLFPAALFWRGSAPQKTVRDLGWQFLVISAWICVVWVLLFFGPQTTIIHQGSLALLVFLFGGAVLFIAGRSLKVAIVFAVVHFLTVFFLFFRDGWTLAGVDASIPLYVTTVCSFLASLGLLMKLSSYSAAGDGSQSV